MESNSVGRSPARSRGAFVPLKTPEALGAHLPPCRSHTQLQLLVQSQRPLKSWRCADTLRLILADIECLSGTTKF